MPRSDVSRRSSRIVQYGSLVFRVLTEAHPVESLHPPVVLIHGVGMSHRYLSRLHDELALSRRVLSIDLPGYGGLPKPDHDVGIAEMAAALGDVLDNLQLPPATFVGHSMGVQWTTELAVQRPDRVAQLVLIGPVTDERGRTLPAQALRLGLDTFGETPGANVIVFTDYLRCGVPWYLAQVRHMLAYRLEERIRQVAAPVLVMRGGHDPIAPTRWCRKLRDLAPVGSFVTIPGCGHVAQHAAPRAVGSAIRAFVAGAAPRASAASETRRGGTSP